MAQTVSSLVVKIGADIRELQSAMKTASKSVQDTGKKMSSMGKTISTRVTAPLVALGGLALKQAADFETLRTSMDILNGSVEEGARNFERLKEFSSGTPFQLGDLAKAQNMLQGFGLEADHAFESLSMIGDIAAATGSDVNSIARVFGKSAAEGRLMTEEILQLVDNGVPAFKLLAETMNVPQSEIRKLAETGQISFDTLQQAFKNTTQAGGLYEDGMKKQSQTIAGLFSTLKDNVNLALGEIGNELATAMNLKELVPALIERIKQVTAWFKSLSQEARTSIVNIVRTIALIGPALVAVGTTVTALGLLISALASPITLVVGAIAGIATAFTYVYDNFEAFKERFSDIGWWRNAIIDMVQFLIEWSPMSLMIKQMNALIGFFSDAEIPNVFEGVAKSLEGLKGDTKEYENEFGSLKDAFINTINEFTGINLGTMFKPVAVTAKEASTAVKELNFSSLNYLSTLQRQQEIFAGFATETKEKTEEISNASAFAMDIANSFTSSFGQGMANVVVQGEKLVDTLKNIGKLLASAVIQKGLSVLLTGGLGGSGFFGSGGGLFGKIFGVNDALITSGGDVVKFNSADDILASKNMDKVIGGGGGGRVEVFGTIKGDDIWISSTRGSKTYGR